MALIRMCVVPNCSQRRSRPILWIVTVCATYWTHTTAVCVFSGSLNPPSASHPPPPTPQPRQPLPPPPIPHPLIRAICDITVAVKKVAQNPAVLASYQK